MLSLGIDIGSSSVKVSIYNHESGRVLGASHFPKTSMDIIAHQEGWAEQEPDWWWQAFKKAYSEAIQKNGVNPKLIECIGIAYQMHGLVCLDKNKETIRPSIIWCDSRAVKYGEDALASLREDYVFHNLLNSPGNFTASKLKWVKENEPEVYDRIDKICLPGDYIAMKLTGELTTTISGLSEGIFYDFKNNTISQALLDYFGFSERLLPIVKKSFDNHGSVNSKMAEELGLSTQATVSYKAGDQPNNALSLNVLKPGEFAATAGTSGVIYGVTDALFTDESQRVNSFAHVNHTEDKRRIGTLLCVNGTGIANTWAHKWTKASSYEEMNHQAEAIEAGSNGLSFFPFGNGAERMLKNQSLGSKVIGLEFNMHTPAHLYRAVQEGIAYALFYGMSTFVENNFNLNVIRAGNANMFLSPLFGQLLSTLSGVEIELYDTDGSLGAARGALIGCGKVDEGEAFHHLHKIKTYTPNRELEQRYEELYLKWNSQLTSFLQ